MDLTSIGNLSSLFFLCDTSAGTSQIVHAVPPGSERGWQVIVATLLGSFLAQALKILTKLIKTGHLDLRMVAKTGGMPSSHSCCTMAMATSVGLIEGFNSVSFAIALCLALIVMYDAAGVRRTVGLQAKVLNEIMIELFSEHPKLSSERIKEFLGHTPIEVLVGAVIGTLIGVVFNIIAVQHVLR